MADVFRRFTQKAANTNIITIFTVPTANVAATPPTPVSTFIVKTIVLHNDSGSGTVNAKITHNNGTTDVEINNIDVAHGSTQQLNGPFVYEAGDSLKIQASTTDLTSDISVLEVKQQQ